jgi:two-component system, OmpR family, sensor kinase
VTGARHSLRRRLTARLLTLQFVALFAVAISSALIFFTFDDYSGAHFNLEIPDVIAGTLGTDGEQLTSRTTADLEHVLRQSPALWFIAEDQAGRRVERGTVPPDLVPILVDLNSMRTLEIVGDDRSADAFLEEESSPAGDVKIVFGNGAVPSWHVSLLTFAGLEVGPILALIVLMLGGLTILVVPRVVEGSLSSLQAVERVASTIDIDQRGVRLPQQDIPTEVAALVDAVNAALSRLDEGFAQKQRFLADAAHELRTPIAILQSRLELAPRAALENRLLLDVHRLANLAEQLLDLQQVGAKGRAPQAVDMVVLARQVVADLAPLALAAGYDPVFETQVERMIVNGDRSALERALINLVQNAITHGGGGGDITVSIGGDHTIAISDNGPGIPEDRREWIFEPFHRVRPSSQGSGLGLSIVRQVVEQHGGSVTVSSSLTGGARFLVRFSRTA